ncbi:MAG: tRNA (N(6)-L-threonylcarbamoyladenosine(37)-C(2))-methylthiotransferase MtaB [Anaerolinea sp.]|nr:tRNA (N(6)-L-threonylcarbamoyladenosine(37)-C(2))-methylthiotransferase MtaB [Anaerolinea sp.]
MTRTVYLRTLGCRLNQAEIDAFARAFANRGYNVVDTPEDADEIVVNTCAVTEDAVRSGRQLIRQLHRANPEAAIVVTGCQAQIQPEAIRMLPGVKQIILNDRKDDLVAQVTGAAEADFDQEPHLRGTPAWMHRTRAFVKVQDGCDNACTFCVTTIARGAGRSRPVQAVVSEVRLLLALGYQEIVLTGVHLGSYGRDLVPRVDLRALVKALLEDTDVVRLRLSSLEPWDLDEQFFTLWQDRRLCPHLHLPLQSGCDTTLRRMARRTSQAQFSRLVEAARANIEQPSITTDVIVGFPGETDAEFDDSVAFIERMRFSGIHVFRYSRRPGTAAARMRSQVAEPVKKARSERLHDLAQRAQAAFATAQIGRIEPILWENVAGSTGEGFINVGYTPHYVRVTCVHPRPLTNHIVAARLLEYDPDRQVMRCQPEL